MDLLISKHSLDYWFRQYLVKYRASAGTFEESEDNINMLYVVMGGHEREAAQLLAETLFFRRSLTRLIDKCFNQNNMFPVIIKLEMLGEFYF